MTHCQTEKRTTPGSCHLNGSLKTSLLSLFLLGLLACGGGGGGGEGTDTQQTTLPQLTYLKQAAIPFTSVEPTSPDGDLAFLDGMIGNTKLIGLGEATHGTSEFQKMKHRIFRYLVEHKGFRAFGMEAQMGRCMPIDHYVLTGEGDPVQLVAANGFWTWRTSEVVDLVTWMREYNADPSHVEKLRFFGVDMQDGATEMDLVLAYLHPIDPAAESVLRSAYAPLRPYVGFGDYLDYTKASDSLRMQCRQGVLTAQQWLADHRSEYAQATGQDAYEWALRLATTVVQTESMLASQSNQDDWVPSSNSRDASMADNASWFVQSRMPGVKAVLWAHNGHVNHRDYYTESKPMGQWLAERFPSDYLDLGFAFYQGSAMAVVLKPDGTYGSLQSNPSPPMGAGSFESVFTMAGFDRAVLDLRTVKASSATGADWWRSAHNFREFGAVWSSAPTWGYEVTTLSDRFHVLVFIKDSTATHYYRSPGLAASQPSTMDCVASRRTLGRSQ